jgi:hypothetical protein
MTQSDVRSFEHIFGTLVLEKSSVGEDQRSLLAVGMSGGIGSHKPTSGQRHVSLAENHPYDPVSAFG